MYIEAYTWNGQFNSFYVHNHVIGKMLSYILVIKFVKLVDSTLAKGRQSMKSKYLRNLHKLMNETLS